MLTEKPMTTYQEQVERQRAIEHGPKLEDLGAEEQSWLRATTDE